ncbi:MAG: type II secretion system protein GspG [Arenicella sp.]|nr:type II secretion system protein GspG [Arenicella sp.]
MKPSKAPFVIALSIGSFFAFIFVSQIYGEIESSKRVKVIYTKNSLEVLSERVVLYRKDTSKYPKSLNDLTLNYLKKIPTDGWQKEYVYIANNDFVQIVSYGADGVIGGESYDSDLVVKITKN